MPTQSTHYALLTNITITKCDHHGAPQIAYPGRVVYADEQVLVARCVWSLQKTYRLGAFEIVEGDLLIECYYAEHWFNVFAVYNPAGRLKGWYCNITYPTTLAHQQLQWHDLALDLLVLPNGTQHILDRDEFCSLSISAADRAQAEAALTTLIRWARAGQGPFATHRINRPLGVK